MLSLTPTSKGFVARTPSTAFPRMLPYFDRAQRWNPLCAFGGSTHPTTEPLNSLTTRCSPDFGSERSESDKLRKNREKSLLQDRSFAPPAGPAGLKAGPTYAEAGLMF